MTWRLAHSLEVLRDEVNAAWPHRSKAADGTIGDVAHQNQGSASDHNPWVVDHNGVPVVRAFDITADGIPAHDLAERIRRMGEAGDPRLADHGYVIFDHQIASYSNWQWHPETGDPHTSHIHVSVSRAELGYDDGRRWGVTAAPFDPLPEDPDMAFGTDQAKQLSDIANAIFDPVNGMQKRLADTEAAVAKLPTELVEISDVERAIKVMFTENSPDAIAFQAEFFRRFKNATS